MMMKRAIDIGPVDAAAIKTAGGKVRLRLLFTVEQLENLLAAANEPDDGDATANNVTHGDAREDSEQNRQIRGGDAPARPPPDESTKRVFVIDGTPAWLSWVDYKRRTSGIHWTLKSTAEVDGKQRSGWWFPTLFPPRAQVGTGPPSNPLMTEEDLQTEL